MNERLKHNMNPLLEPPVFVRRHFFVPPRGSR
jgi:hypothetical protein